MNINGFANSMMYIFTLKTAEASGDVKSLILSLAQRILLLGMLSRYCNLVCFMY